MKTKRKGMSYAKWGYIFLAPFFITFFIFQFWPLATTIYYSFFEYFRSGLKIIGPNFVGLKNYIRLFKLDPEFWGPLKVTLLYTVITVPGKLTMALFIATLLNRNVKGIGAIRTIYYLPSLFGGSVAVAILWKILFMSDGAINNILSSIHLPTVQWLGNGKSAVVSICMLEIWQFGSSMVMFLAALKQVPKELYEAASIDGAGKVRSFFSITVPQITPIIFFNMIMQTINALQTYTSASVITGGGPLKATYVMGLKLYKEGFSYFKMGYASAISWVMFTVILVVTLLLFKSSSSWVYYEDGGDF